MKGGEGQGESPQDSKLTASSEEEELAKESENEQEANQATGVGRGAPGSKGRAHISRLECLAGSNDAKRAWHRPGNIVRVWSKGLPH